MNTATIASWLLTYLIHSTTLLGAAWLISRILGEHRLALQETLLRTALIGGLLTTTLQIGLNVEPIGGSLAIADLSITEFVSASTSTTTGVAASDIAFSPIPVDHSQTLGFWPVALLSLWGLGSLMALLVLGRSVLDLKRLLKTRRIRPAGRLVERLATAMGLRRSIRLSTSAAIAVPFATGIRRPEICCPERVSDLAVEHQTGLFAHELAHLARRDPAWQLLYRLGEAIFFLQPLNRLVRRRLEEIAEHLTDERAVACTGNRLGLARCLVVVAHWGGSSSFGTPVAAFAAGPRLDRRVRRLISGTTEHRFGTRWALPLVVALLMVSISILPTVGTSPAHAGPSSPPIADTTTWSVYADESDSSSDVATTNTWSTGDDRPTDTPPPSDSPAPPVPDQPVPPEAAVPAPEDSTATPEVAPVPETVPAPSVVPRSSAAPHPVTAPAPSAHPAPAVSPESRGNPAPPKAPEARSEPAPPASPDAPQPPPRSDEPAARPAPDEPAQREREQAREEARDRQRETQRERSEAQARAREQARFFSEESRALAKQARELAREAAERTGLTDAEREKLRDEARELQKQARVEAQEFSRAAAEQSRELTARSRELAREAAERNRLTKEKREEMRRQAEVFHAEAREHARVASREAREQARELSEQARRLAEEAEAERRAEEERKRREKVE